MKLGCTAAQARRSIFSASFFDCSIYYWCALAGCGKKRAGVNEVALGGCFLYVDLSTCWMLTLCCVAHAKIHDTSRDNTFCVYFRKLTCVYGNVPFNCFLFCCYCRTARASERGSSTEHPSGRKRLHGQGVPPGPAPLHQGIKYVNL